MPVRNFPIIRCSQDADCIYVTHVYHQREGNNRYPWARTNWCLFSSAPEDSQRTLMHIRDSRISKSCSPMKSSSKRCSEGAVETVPVRYLPWLGTITSMPAQSNLSLTRYTPQALAELSPPVPSFVIPAPSRSRAFLSPVFPEHPASLSFQSLPPFFHWLVGAYTSLTYINEDSATTATLGRTQLMSLLLATPKVSTRSDAIFVSLVLSTKTAPRAISLAAPVGALFPVRPEGFKRTVMHIRDSRIRNQD